MKTIDSYGKLPKKKTQMERDVEKIMVKYSLDKLCLVDGYNNPLKDAMLVKAEQFINCGCINFHHNIDEITWVYKCDMKYGYNWSTYSLVLKNGLVTCNCQHCMPPKDPKQIKFYTPCSHILALALFLQVRWINEKGVPWTVIPMREMLPILLPVERIRTYKICISEVKIINKLLCGEIIADTDQDKIRLKERISILIEKLERIERNKKEKRTKRLLKEQKKLEGANDRMEM